MPNDVRGYQEECVWSEKEKIGVLQAAGVARRGCCERLSGLLHVMARRRRRREEKGFGLVRKRSNFDVN
jgi:hypothetical protein